MQKIDELKQYLPDLGWMKDYLPESDTLHQASESLRRLVGSVHEKFPEKVISLGARTKYWFFVLFGVVVFVLYASSQKFNCFF